MWCLGRVSVPVADSKISINRRLGRFALMNEARPPVLAAVKIKSLNFIGFLNHLLTMPVNRPARFR
jgi:hypothetical protein